MDVEDYISKDLQNFMWSFLGPDDLCSVSQVCKIFHETSKKDIHWLKFIHPAHQEKALRVGVKNFFIEKMRSYFSHMVKQKKIGRWFCRQVTDQKNPKREYFINSYTFLSPSPRVEPAQSSIPCDFLAKIILIGDSGVGKTSLNTRFTENSFQKSDFTIGVEFSSRVLRIQGRQMKLQVWDLAGPERFRAITNSYYRGAHGVILCFDLNRIESFKHIDSWYQEIDRYANPDQQPHIILCGNKCDLEQKVDQEEIDKFCQEHSLHYFKTSSKEDIGVFQTFEDLAELILGSFPGTPFGLSLPPQVFNFDPVLDVDQILSIFESPITNEESSSSSSSSYTSICSIQ